MRRREFIFAGCATLVLPPTARAQQPAIPVVGYLSSGRSEKVSYFGTEFRDALLVAAGFVEGKDVDFDYRYAEQNLDRLPALAIELVARRANVIFAVGNAPLRAARAATKGVPIVAIDLQTDPVEAGFAASLARPGGNVTGIFLAFPEMAGKWLQLLKQACPRLSRVAVLYDPSGLLQQRKAVEDASAPLKVSLEFLEVRAVSDFSEAFHIAAQRGVDGVLILDSPLFLTILQTVAEFAVQYKLPALYTLPEFARAGGLMSYGVNLRDTFREAGVMTAKVLRGTKPADLAIELPTRFELIINLRTAKAIGLTVPDSLLAAADEVIE